MHAHETLLDAVTRAASAAEQLAAARRDVVAALGVVTKAHQQATRRLDGPPLVRLDRFDRELATLLAGGGFVAPFNNGTRPSRAERRDAGQLGWTASRDAETADQFVARWRRRVEDLARTIPGEE